MKPLAPPNKNLPMYQQREERSTVTIVDTLWVQPLAERKALKFLMREIGRIEEEHIRRAQEGESD